MLGTGLPEALHSNVTVLPFRAVTCPVSGCALTVGGTKISTVCTKSLFSWSPTGGGDEKGYKLLVMAR